MTQMQLECAIARVTGENLETIQHLGFSRVRLPRSLKVRSRRRRVVQVRSPGPSSAKPR
jgi:hypothetical protein